MTTRLFDELMAEVMASADTFGHRQHVHLTWLAVRRAGMPAAVTLVLFSARIRRAFSRAWVELVAHHAAEDTTPDFTAFAGRNPELLDKRLLARFYRSTTLAGTGARTGWVEPDLAPFPWTVLSGS